MCIHKKNFSMPKTSNRAASLRAAGAASGRGVDGSKGGNRENVDVEFGNTFLNRRASDTDIVPNGSATTAQKEKNVLRTTSSAAKPGSRYVRHRLIIYTPSYKLYVSFFVSKFPRPCHSPHRPPLSPHPVPCIFPPKPPLLYPRLTTVFTPK